MCVGIYICAFFCSESCKHFTGVVGTSAWAGVYVTQVCFYTNVFLHQRTHLRTHLLQVVHICVLCVRSYVHFVCVCAYMCMCVCVRT